MALVHGVLRHVSIIAHNQDGGKASCRRRLLANVTKIYL